MTSSRACPEVRASKDSNDNDNSMVSRHLRSSYWDNIGNMIALVPVRVILSSRESARLLLDCLDSAMLSQWDKASSLSLSTGGTGRQANIWDVSSALDLLRESMGY